MAAPNSGKVRIAGTGNIFKAPLGTTLPPDSTTAWGAAFLNLGYMTDGFQVAQALSTKEVPAWQSLESLRTIPISLIRKFTFDAVQTDKETLALAWGGATITSNPATLGTATIAATGVVTCSATETLAINDPVQFGAMTLAAPFVAATTYYVVSTPTSTTFTLALTVGGAAIVSAAGSSVSITKMGPYAMAIPNALTMVDFILGIDVTDGATNQRFIVQRARQTALPTIKMGRQTEISYTIEVEALAPADGTNSVLIYGVDSAVGA